jgi:hypothetical protein
MQLVGFSYTASSIDAPAQCRFQQSNQLFAVLRDKPPFVHSE